VDDYGHSRHHGLARGKLDSVSKIVSAGGLKSGLILFTFSLFVAVISKQVGMALANGLETINKLESLLNSEEGQRLMSTMSIESIELTRELAEPFFWPMSRIVRRGGEQGVRDYLSADKRLIRLFCVQLYLNILHILFAGAALITLTCLFDAGKVRLR
jgi:hypothetical protein